ncbi:carbohydrate-binding protein [Paracoccaceae bacterium GXU_MW_L88]
MAFPIVFQDTEFDILSTDTVRRNIENKETNPTNDPNEYTADGLRPGYSGEGYVDFGGAAGDKFSITIPASELDGSETYGLVIKWANGGTGAVNTARPISVFNGTTEVLNMPNTNTGSFAVWDTQTFDIALTETDANGDYVLTFRQLEGNGPNIDGIAIVEAGGSYSFLDPEFEGPQSFDLFEGETEVGTLLAEDADGQDVSYAITGGADAALFNVDPATGALTFINAPVYNADGPNTYDVEVTATDEAGASTAQSYAVNVAAEPVPIDPIYIQAETGAIFREGTGAPGSKILTQTNDADEGASGVDAFNLRPNYSGEGYLDFGATGDGISYTVNAPLSGTYDLHIRYASSTTRSAQVRLDGATVETLSFAPTGSGSDAFNDWKVLVTQVTLEEGENTLSLFLNDGNGPNVDVLALTAVGGTPDFGPRFDVPGEFTMDEGVTEAGSVAASDVVSDTTTGDTPGTVTYAITGGADAALVLVDATSGALTLSEAADFEAKSSYEVEVTATDEGGNSVAQDVIITVNDVDEAPTAPLYSGDAGFTNDIAAGTVVGSVSATDPEGNPVTFTADDTRFEVIGTDIVVADGATFTAGEPLNLTITASDGAQTSQSSVTFTVTEAIVDEAPSAPVYTGDATFADDIEAGDVVGTVESTDPEGNPVTFTVDDARFDIIGTDIVVADGATFTAGEPLNLTITASDGAQTSQSSVTFTVTEAIVDEAPSAPVYTGDATFADDIEAGDVVGSVESTDPEGNPVTFAVDDARFEIIGTDIVVAEGATFTAGEPLNLTITASDGAQTSQSSVSFTVTEAIVDEAPSAPVYTGDATFADDIEAGDVVGTVESTDPEGNPVTFTVDDARFEIVGTDIVVAEGASFTAGEPLNLTITASDGAQTSQSSVSFTVTEGDSGEPGSDTVFDVTFSQDSIVGYTGNQDGGNNYVVEDGGATLALNDNHWKRAFLGTDYVITEDTRISVDVTIGQFEPELVAVGFDLDNDGLDTDGSVYLLDGTDSFRNFIDLKGTGTPVGGGTVRYVIDLSAHAGKTIDSLVFVSDEDNPRNGLGTVSFTNVQLIEEDNGGTVDEAPSAPVYTGDATFADDIEAGDVVGTVESTDPEGNPVTFTVDDARFEIVGTDIVVAEGASFTAGEPLNLTITASDGAQTSQSSVSFTVTEGDTGEPGSDTVFDVTFSQDSIVGYTGNQDGGNNYVVEDGGATLALNDNHWKRAFLGTDYVITEDTRISVDVTIGQFEPELVAVGFDLDNDGLDTDGSVYLLDGTDSFRNFIDLKGTGTPVGGGTVRYVIDLSAHAGETIDSLVFVSDEDNPRNGLGTVSFTNVQLIEEDNGGTVDEAPSAPVYTGDATFADDIEAGDVVGTVASTDPEGNPVTFTVDDARFEIIGTDIVVADGATFTAGEALNLTITASDGAQTSQSSVSFTVTEGDPGEPGSDTVFDVTFSEDSIVGYTGNQDGGNNYAVEDGGATLALNDNHWKRAFLGTDYVITEDTRISVDVTIGQFEPELVAVGFDLDNDGLDTDGSVYLLDGTDSFRNFIDLKGTGTSVGGGTVRYVIDLSAHAGKTIDSLVFVSDEDNSRNGLGTVSFTNVQLIEEGAGTDVNEAPEVIGGGIVDLELLEGANLELDLPFSDPEGESLTYSFTVTDENGADVTGQFSDISFNGNAMLGTLPKLPGTYTVTVTADDGASQNATTSDSFQLTLGNVNDAPVTAPYALEEYFGDVNQEFQTINILDFAEYFSDPDGDALTLSVDTSTLPDGITYDPATQTISGTPTEGGLFNVDIIATDPGGLTTNLTLEFNIDAPQVGDTFTIEAEDFTGLPDATGFYQAAAASASGYQLIRTNANTAASVTTDLGAGDIPPGYYTISVTVYDETDGSATFSIDVDGVSVADNASFDDDGEWLNGDGTTGRGAAGQAGNRKLLTFDTVVYVEEGTILTLTGLADSENLRIDNITLTRTAPQDGPPTAPSLDNASVAENADGAVIGALSATDPDGDAITFSTDDARFTIDGNTLSLADGVSLDHEESDSVQVEVTATDADGNATSTTLDIAVEDVNEAPELADGATLDDVTLDQGTGGTVDVAAALGATDPDGDAVTYTAQLAGGDPLPAGISLVDGVLTVDPALPQGNYTVDVFATDGSLDSESVQFTLTVGEPPVFAPITLQAEDAAVTLSDNPDGDATITVVRDADNPETGGFQGLRPDFNGTGYIDYGDDPGDTLTFTFDVPEAGEYLVNIRYASQLFGTQERSLDIAINGGTAATTLFPSTGPTGNGDDAGFNNWGILTVPVTLEAGSNTVSLAIPAGAESGPNIDQIEITTEALNDTSADEDGVPLFLSGPDGELTETEAASINFNLAGIDADIVKTELSFDGGATRVEVFPDADGDFTVDGSALAPGGYTVITYVTDEVGNEASTSMPIVVADPDVNVDDFTIQAEDASLVTVLDDGQPSNGDFTRVVDADNPDAFGNFRAGAVGEAYIDFGANAGDAIVVNVDAPQAGTYEVTIRYANGGTENRPLDLSLNDGTAQSVDFVPGPVVDGNGWESWVTQTVELELTEGGNQIRLEIPAGATAGPNIDELSFSYQDGGNTGTPFSVTIEGETFVITDAETEPDTVHRTPDNPEPGANAGNSGPGLDFDSDGLRPGSEGNGYLDMGGEPTDSAAFSVDVPEAGEYQLTVRYANGGNADRPMTLSVNGVTQTLSFPQSTETTEAAKWSDWMEVTVDVTLSGGTNEISFTNVGNAGPNIDNVTISNDDGGPVDERELVRFEEVVKINFQPPEGQTQQGLPSGYTTPDGYEADTGAAYGDRGNGFTYGWVSEDSVADGTANGTTPLDQPANAHWYKNTASEATDLQKTYAHFEYPGAGANGSRAWEMALEDGTYQITMSVGDTAGAFDSNYVINVEGQSFMPDWVPANPIDGSTDGEGFRSTLVTGIVQVTDGKLTIDSIGGENTEIQYLEIEQIPDLTPDDDRSADLDYSFFTSPVAANLDGQTTIEIGPDGELPTDIDPTSSLVVGVNLQAPGNRGPNVAYVDNVKLVETLTGIEVEIDVQVSGGADSLTIRPLEDLKENTSYTLKVQDVMDLGAVSDPDAPLRQMQDLTTTFVTGEAPEDVAREVAFDTTTQLDGFGDGAFGYTTIEFGPDGKLYVGTITGEIHRWDVNADGSIDKASQETLSLDYLEEGTDRRGIVGMVFDPNDPNTIWITDNAPIPRESKAYSTPEFSGRVSKITLGDNGDFDTATAETFAFGFPRSGGDHLTNSLEFRKNPDFGQADEPEYLLYLSQGSNSAAGDPDNAWGNRPERLFNAAILEIDISQEAPAGGFDVRTEPIDYDDVPTTTFPDSDFNDDGTYPGMYNPYADDAVVKIYATGVRNAYDLVWHSNGNLYVPTNGTASGGKTPTDPTQPGLDTTITNSPKQYDYLFTVDEGGYYGHPVTLRDEYVLNGGNPTSGLDPNEVVSGNDGNPNTDGYEVGVQPDENYDLDGVYNLGYNRSPNGVTEYTGNAFGSNLKGAVVFAQFSVGDNVRYITVDELGNITGDDVLRRPDGSVIDDYIDPLDIIENPVTGQLYLMTLNRGTGASQLILLTPAPGGVTQDISANEGGDLALVAFDVSDPSAAIFQVNGLDDDITALRVSFDGGPETTVTLDSNNQFTIDLGVLEGNTVATLEVTDDDLNTASVSTTFVPGEEPEEFVPLLSIQAEDYTPLDGTSVEIATNGQIQIRTEDNPETGTGKINGLWPGAYGNDGNTDNLDGEGGGYADFGSTNADFMTFTFDVPADKSGSALLQFRYANGSNADRPLQVEVNGTIVEVASFPPTTAATSDESWANWQIVEVPATLVSGQNAVTLRSVANTGPNIDQLEVLVSTDNGTDAGDGIEVVDGTVYTIYEAENAALDGPVVVTEDRDQSGNFVDFNGSTDQSITWTIDVPEDGEYGLDILYALSTSKQARPMSLSVNGADAGDLAFTPNSNQAESVWGPQQTTVTLTAGTNTITVTAPAANGPNVDYLRVTQEPITPFVAVPADIDGAGRIELEADDGSANTVSGSEAVFYFTVAEDGTYLLDAAANAGAPNGQGLTWELNGVEISSTGFPGEGEDGEETVYADLQAGTTYELRITSDAPGASQIDYLDVTAFNGNANAEIAIQSLDATYADDRLHFSYLEDPVQDGVTRDYKDTGVVRISNNGTEDLTINDVDISGPFAITSPATLEGTSIAAGSFIDVTVSFDRAAYTPPTSNINGTSTVFDGRLRISTNDADTPFVDVDLAGFWQARPEGGQEPNVNEVWEVFGFGNRIEGLTLLGGGENSTLSTNDVFGKTDETEVLSPYWKLADGVTEAKITQISAFHGPGGATLGIHNPGNKGQDITFWSHEGTDNQRLLPNEGNDNTFATETFGNGRIPASWQGDGVFGIEVAGLSTDPRLNPTGGVVVEGEQQGHTVKVFQALDQGGDVIPNVYLVIMDYTGINYDYNDNMYVVEGIAPVGFGQTLDIEGLDDAAADDRLVFTNIDNPANSQQEFRNEATVTLTNDGFAALTIEDIVLGDPENFQIVGTIPTEVPAGGSVDLTIEFVGTHTGTSAGAEIMNSTLTVISDDITKPEVVVQLAGIAQEFSENGSEPTVAQIVEAFGYSTDMAQGELAGGGVVETVGDEVLMPYMEALDPSQNVEVIQLAAFLQYNNVARLNVHGLESSDTTELFAQDNQQAQTVLPDGHVAGTGDTGSVARATISGDDPFGLFIAVDGRPTYASWTDPEANKIDPNFGQLVGDNQGHLIRFFQALDANGDVIEGTFIAIQDYPGAGNYDYNDHMFVIKNVKPYQLTGDDDANGDDVNDALQLDTDNDGTVNFFDPDNTPEPEAGDFVLGINFGGGAIANDPVLGVALVGQDDPRVTLSGAINPGAGTDNPNNPNGAGATAGSAFKTYEDGTNWNASIDIPNGTYVVTLWTQETYFNAAGQRQFDAAVNGQQVITNLDPFAEVGPDTPVSYQTVVTVTNGTISIDMSADINNAPLNAVTIYQAGGDGGGEVGQTPFGGTPVLVDGEALTIDASDYDDGGQGVAYNDDPGLAGGTNGGRAGSDVEQTAQGHIGWIADGEWLEYTINVAEDGVYDVSFLSAFGGSGARSIEASFRKDGVPYESSGAISVDPTGGWTTFAETGSAQVELEAGVQVMRVAFSGGSQDLASINLTPAIGPQMRMLDDSSMAARFAPSVNAQVAAALPWDAEDGVDADLSALGDDTDMAEDEAAATQLGNLFGHDLIS